MIATLLALYSERAQAAAIRTAAPAPIQFAARHLPPLLLAKWTDEDLKRSSTPVPAEVEMLLAREFPSRAQVPIMWNELRKCYADEAAAITAAKRTTSLILPYMNSPANIQGCYSILVDLLGEYGARDVCVRNPAVLGNDPASLRGCSAKDIQDSARLRELIDTKLPFGLRFWASAFIVAAIAGIAIALVAPAAASVSAATLELAATAPSGAALIAYGSPEGVAFVTALVVHWLLWAYSPQSVALCFDFVCIAEVLWRSSSSVIS